MKKYFSKAKKTYLVLVDGVLKEVSEEEWLARNKISKGGGG